ncbi:MAG: two-component regulator propeller domain-containing protein [Prolixibacteraceae bacterium]
MVSLSRAQSNDYKFRNFDTSHGLSDNQVNYIFEDRRGTIWISTLSGLNQFDGYRFKEIRGANSNDYGATSNIERIYEDDKGILWLRLYNNRCVFYNPENDTFSQDHELYHKNIFINQLGLSGMLMDADSNLWLSNNATGLYKYNVEKDFFTQYLNDSLNNQSISSNRITSISTNSSGNIVLMNNKGIVEELNRKNGEVLHRIHIENIHLKSENNFFYLFVDNDDDYWVYGNTPNGLFYCSSKDDTQIHFTSSSQKHQISNDLIRGLIQDKDGKIWAGSDHGGLNIISKTDFSTLVIQENEGVENSLSNNSVTALRKDVSGGIWVGTFKEGLNFYHPLLYQFGLIKKNPYDPKSLQVNDISCFTEDGTGNLWMGTNEKGLIYYDRKRERFSQYSHLGNDPNSLSNNVVVSVLYDSKNRLWIGTYQGGLDLFDGKKFHHFKNDPDDISTIAHNVVWKVFEDSKGRIWIGTLGGGLDLFDPEQNRFTHYKGGIFNSVRTNFIQQIYETANGDLWIGTTEGIDILESNTGRFLQFPNQDKPYSLTDYVVTSITEDSRGWMWIGTRRGLNCYDPASDSLLTFFREDGLPDHIITSIQLDDSGGLWVATRNGLSNIQIEGRDLSNARFNFTSYSKSDGLQGNEFNISSGFKTSKGELLFGGVNGFNLFKPSNIIKNDQATEALLTDFLIENKLVSVNEKVGKKVILNKAMPFTSEIKLNYKQNAFSILFSSNNYIHPDKVQFKYQLSEVNPTWVQTDAFNRIATYTNLDPGEYDFRIMASNGNGIWNGPETLLKIKITPPIYASKIAFIFYFILVFLVIQLFFRVATKRIQLRLTRAQEQLEHQRLLDLEAMKTKFFTNVSHEFRTPLTLILSPIEQLLTKNANEETRHQLKIVDRNAKKLLNLVNQLLDLRKLEVQPISLNLSYGNIIAFIRDITDSFFNLYENKGIVFGFETSIQSYETFFDQYKIEKIIFNLLSNAFKFTSGKGKVSLKITQYNHQREEINPQLFDGHEFLEIRVTDTGVGIDENNIEKIFERFYQSGNTNNDQLNQGSGIGLSITKEFVQIHHGTVEVESTKNIGSSFIVRIPFGLNTEHLVEAQNHKTSKLLSHPINESTQANIQESENELPERNKKPSILIVEDNNELRNYLKSSLEKNYTVFEAENGKIGWEKTINLQPTLVISDIMMPLMDGLELCRLIKTDETISHIPIVLLTAKTTLEQKLEGLELGADDYITKPFNLEILELRIKKLIETRLAFQQKVHRNFKIEPGEIGITSLDEKFMQKTIEVVEQNITNPNFSVEEMSRLLGVSRGHLYNKLVALVGKTPIEFIRIMRIKRAAQLLEKSQMMVSSIAYEVGFNSIKYFGRYFKEEYGMTPSAYAKLKSAENS